MERAWKVCCWKLGQLEVFRGFCQKPQVLRLVVVGCSLRNELLLTVDGMEIEETLCCSLLIEELQFRLRRRVSA